MKPLQHLPARNNRLNGSDAVINEVFSITWEKILNHGSLGGHHFLRLRRVGQHTVHFICKTLLLIVDIEPEVQIDPMHRMKMLRRTMELRNMGFYTLLFHENEIRTYPNQVKKLIENRAEILRMKQQYRNRFANT
jgi:very-short-patch-repair endonuclease